MRDYISSTVGIVVVLGLYSIPAQALQGLCSNSPENPTAILGLLCAGAAGYPYLRGRARSLFKRKEQSGNLPD